MAGRAAGEQSAGVSDTVLGRVAIWKRSLSHHDAG